MCLPTGALCCTWTCLSARIFAAPVRVCLQELCVAPGHVCQQECSPGCNCRCSVENLFGLFRFFSKQFCLFRLFRYRFETPKQIEIFLFFVSRNKPKQTKNRSCFSLFRFEPKFIFVCFEDTLLLAQPRRGKQLGSCEGPLGRVVLNCKIQLGTTSVPDP
jgi:hypothetical protein